jgi:thioredoxin-related protein
VDIQLNVKEQRMLREILGAYLSDLRMEIADTDRKDFRDELKEREVFLKDLLARLEGAASQA